MKDKFNKFLNKGVNRGLSWTTVASEKLLLALIGISTCIASANYLYEMLINQRIELADLFTDSYTHLTLPTKRIV